MKFLESLASAIESGKETAIENTSRRAWLKQVGIMSASSLAFYSCGSVKGSSNDSASPVSGDQAMGLVKDGSLLNAALALEHEAIALYTVAAGLDFMKKDEVRPILTIAGTFLSHHKTHRDSLISQIKNLQKKDSKVADPVAAKPDSDYVSPVASKLTDIVQVIRIASLKELEASKAYISLISSFSDPNIAAISGMLGGEEAAHHGVLRAALFAVVKDSDVTAETVIGAAYPSGLSQKF